MSATPSNTSLPDSEQIRKPLNHLDSNTLRAKVIVCGDSIVGKSSLVRQFVGGRSAYSKIYEKTTRVELSVKQVSFPAKDEIVEMLLYDTCGAHVHRKGMSNYWGIPNMYLVVFDVTDPATVEGVLWWADEFLAAGTRSLILPAAVVANKIDKEDERVVSREEGFEIAEDLGLPYFETSAQTGEGVEEPFHYLASEWQATFAERMEMFNDMINATLAPF